MNRSQPVKGKGIPAESACMRGIAANKPEPDEISVSGRLGLMNAELGKVTVVEGGKLDKEKTLDAKAEAAARMLIESGLTEKCRFSYISGMLEERLI